VHTIKEAIQKGHVETKELHDGFVHKQFEGANETFIEYSLPISIGGINRDMNIYRSSFLFVYGFTNFRRFTPKENR